MAQACASPSEPCGPPQSVLPSLLSGRLAARCGGGAPVRCAPYPASRYLKTVSLLSGTDLAGVYSALHLQVACPDRQCPESASIDHLFSYIYQARQFLLRLKWQYSDRQSCTESYLPDASHCWRLQHIQATVGLAASPDDTGANSGAGGGPAAQGPPVKVKPRLRGRYMFSAMAPCGSDNVTSAVAVIRYTDWPVRLTLTTWGSMTSSPPP